ncbi:hypothetical protein [Bordetella genomosp. 13]|uniref:hypothetical protein n=1 Tax=Bordetella genomosp. 13 TaxID=463040 RepID=UPI0011A47F95|nr:hypothetical protein [Bordetella genomosp. 13]
MRQFAAIQFIAVALPVSLDACVVCSVRGIRYRMAFRPAREDSARSQAWVRDTSCNVNNRKLVIVTSFDTAGHVIAATRPVRVAGGSVVGACTAIRFAVAAAIVLLVGVGAGVIGAVAILSIRAFAGKGGRAGVAAVRTQTKKAWRDGQALMQKLGCGGRI